MIEPKQLTDNLSVTGNVQLADLPTIAQSYRTLINNRPDGEQEGQPTSDELKAAAEALGLHYVHLPVVRGQIEDRQVAGFGAALDEAPKPALAFCGTGTRSCSLWALSNAGKRAPAKLLTTAAKAGYDLTSLTPRLQQAAAPE